MTSISNSDFKDFLDEFTRMSPKYYDTIEEISWPKDEDGNNLPNRDPLIRNQFKMLSLDDICKGSSKFDNYNLPSTTDALWYNIKDDGSLVIYFIEFKWHNLNKRYKSPVDSDVAFKLRLKPFESLFIVLPKLFEEYCERNNKHFTGLNEFLKTCEIKVYSFVSNYYRKDGGIKVKRNKSKIHLRHIKTMGPKGSIGNTIHKQYKRLELSPLIDFADVFPKSCFNAFLKVEGLK